MSVSVAEVRTLRNEDGLGLVRHCGIGIDERKCLTLKDRLLRRWERVSSELPKVARRFVNIQVSVGVEGQAEGIAETGGEWTWGWQDALHHATIIRRWHSENTWSVELRNVDVTRKGIDRDAPREGATRRGRNGPKRDVATTVQRSRSISC